MNLETKDFAAFHEAVHGYAPFPWQVRLLEQIVRERAWPKTLDLPTGSGKTTCVDIALFALALDAESDDMWCPRRIAMVVDRRVVVDQVAVRGRKILKALVEAKGGVLGAVADRLKELGGEDEPVGVFTLRGGIPKDDGWARNPAQPLILASTVDQIGSRMLVQGYGVSRSMKPVHAGLLGNDTLLLLDEVHLSKPFASTLDQLTTLRARFEKSLPTRFIRAFLSATPDVKKDEKIFRLTEDEKSRDSALGERLHASKPAKLVEAASRPEVERACIEHAMELLERHEVIAVVMNRVDSARTVSSQLREQLLGKEIDVVLLTGRMRPLDRDDVLAKFGKRFKTEHERKPAERKIVVVGTQCIEAGADFDFNALVTEAASLDALRQRFGRLNRLGEYTGAQGVIVRDKEEKDDPIYGETQLNTWKWLSERATKKSVDFGVSALVPPEAPEELEKLLAPKQDAPVLLPAYLDLWMQTSPEPVQVPDVSLFLHGPKSGPADVTVIWRADLDGSDVLHEENEELAKDTVAAVRPSSLEAMAVPLYTARRWLERLADASGVADVEGSPEPDEKPREPERGRGRLALRWRGDRSEVIRPHQLKGGDTIVVPAKYGGITDGSFDPQGEKPVEDLAERAAFLGRGEVVLRLNWSVLPDLGLSMPDTEESPAEVVAALRASADTNFWPRWKSAWLEAFEQKNARPRIFTAVNAEKATDVTKVLQAKRVPIKTLRDLAQGEDREFEYREALTTDEEDSFYAGVAVGLAKHSEDVERKALQFATRLRLPENFRKDLALAGWLHDIGKADRRFQLMLRGGNELAFFEDDEPLAKSGTATNAKLQQRDAQERSGYPRGARHEMQSVAMIAANAAKVNALAEDPELVSYLVGSHHGWGRPFAPSVVDAPPVDVELLHHRSDDKKFGEISFAACSSDHGLHRLDSALADRFWALVEKFGWQGLCWLEAILRLADHRASEDEEVAS